MEHLPTSLTTSDKLSVDGDCDDGDYDNTLNIAATSSDNTFTHPTPETAISHHTLETAISHHTRETAISHHTPETAIYCSNESIGHGNKKSRIKRKKCLCHSKQCKGYLPYDGTL